MILTHNRRARLMHTLRALERLQENWPIIVVDNGSTDGTAKAVGREFPAVMLIRSRRNIGAAARNIAVAYVHTPYVAFCGDDVLLRQGSLEHAARIMNDNPNIGVVSGCVLEGEFGKVSPACAAMAVSPLDREGLPGPQLLGFTADCCVVRTRAFYDAGGFWPPLFTGGEETLLALDMATRGWRMVYMDGVMGQRLASCLHNPTRKRNRESRNAIWVAWMRLPFKQAWKETVMQLRKAARHRQLKQVCAMTLVGMLPVLKQRKVVAPRVTSMWLRLNHPPPMTGENKASRHRRGYMA